MGKCSSSGSVRESEEGFEGCEEVREDRKRIDEIIPIKCIEPGGRDAVYRFKCAVC
jgi:hypothetical protein